MIAGHLVVKGGVTLGHRLEPVIKIKHHLIERQVIDRHGAAAGIGQIQLDAPTVLAQFQHIAQVFVRHQNGCLDARLFQVIHMSQIGHIGRVVQLDHGLIAHIDVIHHARRRGDQLDIVFAFHPVADHLKVQQAQEATAETKAQRRRGFHLKAKGRIIQRQLVDRITQVFKFGTINREQAAEHHWLRRFKARQHLFGALLLMGDGIAHTGVAHLFDRGGQETNLARPQLLDHFHLGTEDADAVHMVGRAIGEHLDPLALFQHPVHDPHQNDHAEIGVIPAVHQHRL